MSDVPEPAFADSLAAVHETGPLVQSITNNVTKADVAQVIDCWGGAPVMSDDSREVAEMVQLASALHLNMGTVSESGEEAMHLAGEAANDRGVPVVFDPVGAGATPTRTSVATRIVDELDVAVVKGNYGEVSTLAGDDAEVRGVDAVGEYGDIARSALTVAREFDTVVVASGETDIVATDEAVVSVAGGHERLATVVGTGCLLGATVATFCGAEPDAAQAALDATIGFGFAGERAAERAPPGPASYNLALLDVAGTMTPTDASEAVPTVDRLI